MADDKGIRTVTYRPPGEWRYTSGRIVNSRGVEMGRIQFHSDGHVTVECHCPRCEAERHLKDLPEGAIGRVGEDGTVEMEGVGMPSPESWGN